MDICTYNAANHKHAVYCAQCGGRLSRRSFLAFLASLPLVGWLMGKTPAKAIAAVNTAADVVPVMPGSEYVCLHLICVGGTDGTEKTRASWVYETFGGEPVDFDMQRPNGKTVPARRGLAVRTPEGLLGWYNDEHPRTATCP